MNPRYQNIPCKICGSKTKIFGVCDFNKSCEGEKLEHILPLSGTPVYYLQCEYCKFIFTVDFDHWSVEKFKTYIYNDQYILVDPEYLIIRPKNIAEWIRPFINQFQTILDFGSGSGEFSKQLSLYGFTAQSYDPIVDDKISFDKDFKFDIVTAFEVLEHTPDPYFTAKEMIKFLRPKHGKIITMTVTNDEISHQKINHWYIAPRNGHICMHSKMSLEIMFDKLGMKVKHTAPNTQFVFWKE